jgi:hypothetical protein
MLRFGDVCSEIKGQKEEIYLIINWPIAGLGHTDRIFSDEKVALLSNRMALYLKARRQRNSYLFCRNLRCQRWYFSRLFCYYIVGTKDYAQPFAGSAILQAFAFADKESLNRAFFPPFGKN